MALKCPFCQSEHIIFIESSATQNTAMTSIASPATLAALGATVAKSFNLPPLLGGVAGTALGGLVNVLLDSNTPQPSTLCVCQHCYQRFPSHVLQFSSV